MNRPRVLITLYGEAVLTFPYHPALVEGLKREIPSYSRSYDPTTKTWTVSQPYIQVACALVESIYPDVEVEDHSWKSTETPPASSGPKTSYTVLHLLPNAPAELVEVAYRTLARIHHPDRGGDTGKMQELNDAVSTIRRKLA